MKRTGTIWSKDATLSHSKRILVRELDDGAIEYLIGDSARRRDGWATMPRDLHSRIEWD